MKPTISDELAERVLACIQCHNADNRITRGRLAYICQSSDRQIRLAIAQLRDEGYPVISDSGSAGYYYDPSAISKTIADMESRIARMSRIVRALKHGRHEVKQLSLV